jgi:hypothetical protein
VTQTPVRRTCARCGRHCYPAASFPEGHLCTGCLRVALEATGTCPACGTPGRVLPGLRGGVRICPDCAGITRHFSCLHCGTETGMAGRKGGSSRLCGPCALTWMTSQLLDDGTGAISPPLAPLAAALTASPSPATTLDWLEQPHIGELLTHLAAGKLPLTHQGLDAWPRPRATRYLRDLLISCGVLPAADKQLLDYQAWLGRRLAGLASHPHQQLLRQFGTWHQLAAMRARAATGPLRATASQYARTRFLQAETFLTWAAAHHRHPATLLRHPPGPPAPIRPCLPHLGRHPRPHPPPPRHPPPGTLHRNSHHPAPPPGPAAPLRHRHHHPHPAPRRRLPATPLRPATQPHPAPDHH